MYFIEQLFGVSPDGGNGATEAAILLALSLTLVMAVWRSWMVKRRW
jgi:hypothetical protein